MIITAMNRQKKTYEEIRVGGSGGKKNVCLHNILGGGTINIKGSAVDNMVHSFIKVVGVVGRYNISVIITTYVLKSGLQFKVDFERQIFHKLFISILFVLRIVTRNLMREIR